MCVYVCVNMCKRAFVLNVCVGGGLLTGSSNNAERSQLKVSVSQKWRVFTLVCVPVFLCVGALVFWCVYVSVSACDCVSMFACASVCVYTCALCVCARSTSAEETPPVMRNEKREALLGKRSHSGKAK